METIQENIETKKNDSLDGIRTVKVGKRFESYVGWAFSKELECEKYIQSADFSFQLEKFQIENILNEQNLEEKEKEKILSDLNEFESKLQDLKPKSSTEEDKTSKSESRSDNKQIITTSSEDNNQNKNIVINKAKSINYININNNVNLVNKDNNNNKSISDKKSIKTKEKKSKKTKAKIDKQDDISGDFDVIIPNVKKANFLKLIDNNFYFGKKLECIVFEKKKLNKLPDSFHLLIEVGLNVFGNGMAHKAKQIRKYTSIINVRNNIKNDKIQKIYIKDFQRRFSLNFNSDKDKIAKHYVYMLISNSEYATFIERFYNKKKKLLKKTNLKSN